MFRMFNISAYQWKSLFNTKKYLSSCNPKQSYTMTHMQHVQDKLNSRTEASFSICWHPMHWVVQNVQRRLLVVMDDYSTHVENYFTWLAVSWDWCVQFHYTHLCLLYFMSYISTVKAVDLWRFLRHWLQKLLTYFYMNMHIFLQTVFLKLISENK